MSSLDEARNRLDGHYAKQARLNRFRTRAERDAFLNAELKSLREYQHTQTVNLEAAQNDLTSTQRALQDLAAKTSDIHAQLEDRRERLRALSEELTTFRE